MKTSTILFKYFMGTTLWGLVMCLAVPTHALTVEEVPNPRQSSGEWVTDMAEILKPETEDQLNTMINRLEEKDGAEIAVVTVPETKPAASPKAFATELFNYWQIGKQGQDNGILVLIAKGDRRVEIETGNGMQTTLPDAKVTNLINTEILPLFKKNDFDGGTLAGTRSVVVGLEPSLAKELKGNTSPFWLSALLLSLWPLLGLLLVLIGIAYLLYKLGSSDDGGGSGGGGFSSSSSSSSDVSGGGFSGGGSSGGDFGGGGSSGGGGGGSW
jgi:uncharacterized protein